MDCSKVILLVWLFLIVFFVRWLLVCRCWGILRSILLQMILLSFLAPGILSHLPTTCFVNLVRPPTFVLTLVNASFGTKEIPLAITLPVSTNLPFVFILFCLVRLLILVYLTMILFPALTRLSFFVHNGLLNYHCPMLCFTVCLLPLFPYVITISPSLAI